MEKVFEVCCDYDVGEVPKIVVDTNAAADQGVEALVPSILKFLQLGFSFNDDKLNVSAFYVCRITQLNT